jgi:hypothetical protein
MRQTMVLCLLLSAGGLMVGCGGTPKAMAVCKELEAVGVAENCQEQKAPSGVAAVAKERVVFQTPKIATELPGEVLTFNEDRDYLNTVKAYNQLGTFNAMHRYGSAERRVFVAIDETVPVELAGKAKAVVEAL